MKLSQIITCILESQEILIELMNGGAFLNLTGDLAYKALEKIAANTQNWDFSSCSDKSAQKDKK
jgi:hypothetical protein